MIYNKQLIKAILGLSLLYSHITTAVELEVPEHIQVVTLNGEKQSTSFFMWGKTLEVNPGMVSLEVKYRDLLESEEDDSHQTITSAVVSLHFEVVANANQPYRLHSIRPTSVEAAYAFSQKPEFQVLYRDKEVSLLKPNYTSKSASEPKEQGQVVSKLEYWWGQADNATRAAFLKKVSTNH